ncbi:MAG TPA: Gfo/Idh/MocA family oxidoreductase [Terrimicrobiaceae bacterium]|nr:Gfo/Idh/MocA family oxidoreductase [Terrimicrobiaceae bacterium]
MKNAKMIRFAVLGAHGRGRIALHVHRPGDGLAVVAVCATRTDGLEEFRERCGDGLILTTDYREILGNPDIDAVFVCTPDHLHAEHAIAALNAGKHVFLEKPMAITIGDCDAILAAADRGTAKIYVGHNMRFFPVMRKMRELIDAGRIGRVEAVWCRHFISYGGDAYFKDWHSERRHTTGLLLQKGAHDIDIIHYLAGAHTRRVVGMGKLSVYNEVADRRTGESERVTFNRENWPPLSQKGLSPVIDVEDHSMLLLELANGVQASYQQCHYTPDDCRNYTVIGTEGRLENYGDHSSSDRLATVHLWNRRMGYQEQGNEVFRIPSIEGSHGGADPLMLDDFVVFLRGGKPAGASVLDARMAVAAGCLGTESLRNGSVPREVPPVGA